MSKSATATLQRFKMSLRKYRGLHKTLQWLNQKARPAVKRTALQALRKAYANQPDAGLPTGSFSDYEAIKKSGPSSEGGIAVEDQGSPVIPENSIMILCKRGQHLEQPWPILWRHHQNARLIGTSLAHINSQKQLCEEAAYGKKRVKADPAWWHLLKKSPPALKGNWTSIISAWSSNERPQPYAHWLLDALPRLALLKEFPADTGILVSPHRLPYQEQSLALLGLTERVRWTPEQDLIIKDYYFSSPVSMVVCWCPYAVRYLREAFLPLAPENPAMPKRFFVRRKTFGRNMTNEAEVLEFYEKLGWAIVDTGAMTFLEQIQLFAGADAICAIHGSATANMVWCRPGCKMLELFPIDHLAGDQEWIAQCVNADYRFLVFPNDYKIDATVDLSQVRKVMSEMGMF